MMMRGFRHIVREFAQAETTEGVLVSLDNAVSTLNLRLYGIVPRQFVSDAEVGEKTLYGPSVPADFRAEMSAEYRHHARPTAIRHHERERPLPFTLTETMRRVQPSGDSRWVFDTLNGQGVRDGLHCSHAGWGVLYSADQVLTASRLADQMRSALDAVAAIAVLRMASIERPESKATLTLALSPRERAVFQHLSDGLSVGEIADHLKLSEATVRTFILRGEKKLGAVSQLHAVSIAIRLGLI